MRFSSTVQDSTVQERTVRDNFKTIQHDTSQYITGHHNEEKMQYPTQSSTIQFGALFHFSFILPLTIIVNFYTSHLLQHGEVLTKVNVTGRYNNIPYCQAFRR